MAGSAKPPIATLGKESKYTYIDGLTHANKGLGLFDGVLTASWGTGNIGYFGNASHYVIVKIEQMSNLWRYGHVSYPAYSAPFLITKLNEFNGAYEPFTVDQVTTSIGADWEKTIEKIPPGTYKFAYNGARMDGEWFFESVPEAFTLFFHNGVYKTYNNSLGYPSWISVSTTRPIAQQFINYGINRLDDLSPAYRDLEPLLMTNITNTMGNSFSGPDKVFMKTLSFKKNISDINVEVK